jgi:hypothetical protein
MAIDPETVPENPEELLRNIQLQTLDIVAQVLSDPRRRIRSSYRPKQVCP